MLQVIIYKVVSMDMETGDGGDSKKSSVHSTMERDLGKAPPNTSPPPPSLSSIDIHIYTNTSTHSHWRAVEWREYEKRKAKGGWLERPGGKGSKVGP